MHKRISARYANVKQDVSLQEAYGFFPSAEELLQAKASVSRETAHRERCALEGEFGCKLCPKKVIVCQQDLKIHLATKAHRNNMINYFKQNQNKLSKQLDKIKKNRIKESLFSTRRYQRLLRMSMHYKVQRFLTLVKHNVSN